MPQYTQSSTNPFGGSPGGGNYEYWLSTQGQSPQGMQSRQFALMQQRQQAREAQQAGGGGGGAPTPVQMVQNAGYQGLQAAQNPVMPQAPPALEYPTLQQPMGLGELMSHLPAYQPLGSYGAQYFQTPASGAPAASQAPSSPPVAAGPTNITTGITVPQFAGPAALPAMPDAPAWAGGGAAQQNYAMAAQPLQGQLAGDYYAQAGPMTLAAEQARAGAGLGWGGLYNQWLQNQLSNMGQQQSALWALLGGLA